MLKCLSGFGARIYLLDHPFRMDMVLKVSRAKCVDSAGLIHFWISASLLPLLVLGVAGVAEPAQHVFVLETLMMSQLSALNPRGVFLFSCLPSDQYMFLQLKFVCEAARDYSR